MFYVIYKTTNIVNGKFYIGKHQTKNLNDGYLGSGKLLRKAIKKYGVENFHREILYECSSEKEMNLREKILVVPDIETNYNLCPGGRGGFGYINKFSPNHNKTEKFRKARSEAQKALFQRNPELKKRVVQFLVPGNKGDGFLGKQHTEETKRKMSLSNTHQRGENNSQFGTMWITNGIKNSKINRELPIPEGWRKGRTL